MIKRITNTFTNTLKQERSALILFTTAGFPSIEDTLKAVQLMAEGGADIIELGVPFSDPLADGPTIVSANTVAISKGITPQKCIELVKDIRKLGINLPVVLLCYWNSILAMGPENMCKYSAAAEVDGIVVPDLPYTESDTFVNVTTQYDIAFIPLLAPTSTDYSIQKATSQASGFIYCVSSLGVTGERDVINQEAKELVLRVKRVTQIPVAVGFGISNSTHVRQVASYAEGVIVGSAMVNKISSINSNSGTNEVKKFVSMLFRATVKRDI